MTKKMAAYPARDPQLMYDLAKTRLANQLETVNALDTKIGTVVSLASALLGIAAAVYALRAVSAGEMSQSLSGAEIATLAIGGLSYLVVAGFGLHAYFVKNWTIGPDLDAVWIKTESRLSDKRLAWEVANDFMYAYEDNLSSCKAKAIALRVVFAGVIAESLVLATSLSLVAAGV